MAFLSRLWKSEHKYVSGLLSAYLDGELTAWEKSVVEEHLRRCRDCRRDLRALRQIVCLVRQLPEVPVPRQFTLSPAQVRHLPAHPSEVERLRLRPMGPPWVYPWLRGATAVAAVLLVIVLTGDLLSQMTRGRIEKVAPAVALPLSDQTMATLPSLAPTPVPQAVAPTAVAKELKPAVEVAALPSPTALPSGAAKAGPGQQLSPTPQAVQPEMPPPEAGGAIAPAKAPAAEAPAPSAPVMPAPGEIPEAEATVAAAPPLSGTWGAEVPGVAPYAPSPTGTVTAETPVSGAPAPTGTLARMALPAFTSTPTGPPIQAITPMPTVMPSATATPREVPTRATAPTAEAAALAWASPTGWAPSPGPPAPISAAPSATLSPWRLAEIGLGILVLLLGLATLISSARKKNY
jgi:anti-sigma factor RsiW